MNPTEMEAAQLPEQDRLSGLHPDFLRLINEHIPCLVHRRRMARVCTALRNVFNPQHEAATPPLPWILLPRPGGPSFSCVLRGCDTHDLDLDIPADARAARYFGAYEGGWVFLAAGQIDGYALLNLRTHQRFDIPDSVDIVIGDVGVAIVAATLSSPPEHEHCVVAAICCLAPPELVGGPCVRAFWHLGHPVPVNDDDANTAAITLPNLEDVIHYKGAFHFLTDVEDLIVFEPLVHDDGRLEIIPKGTRRFGYPCQYDGLAHARYLVESCGELLMVVRLTPYLGELTLAFRVFQMEQAILPAVDGDNNNAKYSWNWNELQDLGGRMLFIGRGCSRSYKVAKANYPGFKAGVYFLDEGRFYGEEGILTGVDAQEYPCRDIGKWLSSEPIPSIDNFLPEQEPSSYSPPAWFLN